MNAKGYMYISNSPSDRHAELVSASPRITRIIGVILKQVQDDVPILDCPYKSDIYMLIRHQAMIRIFGKPG